MTGPADTDRRLADRFTGGPDAITLRRAQRGDPAAVADVLRLLQDRLWRVCRSLSDDHASAEDAQQESALRIIAGLATFKGQSRLTTWASGIAVNVCREHRRKPRLAPHAFADQVELVGQGEPVDADELASLHAALAKLSERQREAVVLRYLEGLSLKQSAELMGCAEGTVKASVHAGLRNLREELEP